MYQWQVKDRPTGWVAFVWNDQERLCLHKSFTDAKAAEAWAETKVAELEEKERVQMADPIKF